MGSPALNWKNRIAARAEKAVAAVATGGSQVGKATMQRLALMLSAVDVALSELSKMNTLAARQDAKREHYLPQFEDFIAEYLASGQVYSNPVLVWFTLWLFDVRDIGRALSLADVCIEQKQSMPERFRRDMKTQAADQVLDWVSEQLMIEGAGPESVAPHFQTVCDRVLGGEWIVHEAVQVKYAKQAAAIKEMEMDLQGAAEMYRVAQRISGGKAGVKTRLDQIEKELAKAAGTVPSTPA